MSLLTDEDIRKQIAEGNPHDEYEEAEYGRLPVGSLSDEHKAWNEGAAFTLALKVASVPLSELIEKAESGKLVELDEDQTWPEIPEHCAGIVLERDRILRAAGFRRVIRRGVMTAFIMEIIKTAVYKVEAVDEADAINDAKRTEPPAHAWKTEIKATPDK